MQSESGIEVDKSGDGIVQIRLNRPERLNALGVDMVDALERASGTRSHGARGCCSCVARDALFAPARI